MVEGITKIEIETESKCCVRLLKLKLKKFLVKTESKYRRGSLILKMRMFYIQNESNFHSRPLILKLEKKTQGSQIKVPSWAFDIYK